MFFTSSADVADLIDQLSMDHAGATRGRIDIRPTATGQMELAQLPEAMSPRSTDIHSNFSHEYTESQPMSPISPGGRQVGPRHAKSPSAGSFLSDQSGPERTVEDRLQALMDRLKAAPGGVSSGGRGGRV